METFKLRLEQFFPMVLGVVSAGLVYLSPFKLSEIPELTALLNSAVTMSSIIIGFLGAMISVLITISGRKIMKRIREKKAEGLLNWYLREAITSGFLAAVYSSILIMFSKYDGGYAKYLLIGWSFIVVHFVCASYRILHVMMNILGALPDEYPEQPSTSKVYTPSAEKAFSKSMPEQQE